MSFMHQTGSSRVDLLKPQQSDVRRRLQSCRDRCYVVKCDETGTQIWLEISCSRFLLFTQTSGLQRKA